MNVRAACMRSGVVRRVRVEFLYLLLVQICAADRDDNESRRGNLEKAAGPGPPTAKNGTSRLLHAMQVERHVAPSGSRNVSGYQPAGKGFVYTTTTSAYYFRKSGNKINVA